MESMTAAAVKWLAIHLMTGIQFLIGIFLFITVSRLALGSIHHLIK